MKDIADFISNVGFPIFIAVIMMYQNFQFNTLYQKLSESMKDELMKNTDVLHQIIDLDNLKGVDKK